MWTGSRSSMSKDVHVTEVGTADEFHDAVWRGAEHIVIMEHLDLSSLEPMGHVNSDDRLIDLAPVFSGPSDRRANNVQSIRGNCPDAPSEGLLAKVAGAPLLPLQGRQCLILSDLSFLFAQETKVWLDGLYVRHIVTPRTTNWNDGLMQVVSGSAWLTSVTLQGGSEMPESQLYDASRKRVNKFYTYSGDECGVCGMFAGGNIYLESCRFADFQGRLVLRTLAESNRNDQIVVANCTFSGNQVRQAVIHTSSEFNMRSAAVVRLEQTSFENNTGPHTLYADRWDEGDPAVFYTDSAAPLDVFNERRWYTNPDSNSSAAPLADVHCGSGISTHDEFFRRLQRELPSIPGRERVSPPPRAPVDCFPSDRFLIQVYVTIAALLAVTMLTCALCLIQWCYVCWRRRSRSTAAQPDDAKDGLKDGVHEGFPAHMVEPVMPQLEDMSSEETQKLPLLDFSDDTNGAASTESLLGTPEQFE